jgi:hypothetical protein
VWHASAASQSQGFALGEATLRRYALKALDGVGDADLGEWFEMGDKAFHVRRRLTETEARKVGPVIDVRGTPEADRRLVFVRRLIPGYEE